MNIENGQRVSLHYTGRLTDGTVFDSSIERGRPLHFVVGAGVVLPDFEKAVCTMQIGEKKTFDLTSEQAYGPYHKEAIQEMPKERFGDDLDLTEGTMLSGTAPNGQPIQAKILGVKEDVVTLDFNHPLAGKDINFEVELLSIE